MEWQHIRAFGEEIAVGEERVQSSWFRVQSRWSRIITYSLEGGVVVGPFVGWSDGGEVLEHTDKIFDNWFFALKDLDREDICVFKCFDKRKIGRFL